MDQIRNCLSYEDFIDIIDSGRIIAKKQIIIKMILRQDQSIIFLLGK